MKKGLKNGSPGVVLVPPTPNLVHAPIPVRDKEWGQNVIIICQENVGNDGARCWGVRGLHYLI